MGQRRARPKKPLGSRGKWTSQLGTIDPRKIPGPQPGDRHWTPDDPAFVEKFKRCHAGEAPVRRARVKVADIVPVWEPGVNRARLFLIEEPTTRELFADMVRDPKMRKKNLFTLYKGDDGRIMMSDDYTKFAMALDLGVQDVEAVVMDDLPAAKGETNEQRVGWMPPPVTMVSRP